MRSVKHRSPIPGAKGPEVFSLRKKKSLKIFFPANFYGYLSAPAAGTYWATWLSLHMPRTVVSPLVATL